MRIASSTSVVLAVAGAMLRGQDEVQRPQLEVLLPDARVPAREALRVVDRVVAAHRGELAVVVVWPGAATAARIGRGAPAGVAESTDPAGARRAAVAGGRPAGDAVGVWSDAAGAVVLVASLDDGARHVAADLCGAGRLGPTWEPWVAAVAQAADEDAVRIVAGGAVEELERRPEFLARVLEAAVARFPALAQEPDVVGRASAALAAAPRCEAVQRAAFVVHAARGDRTAALVAAHAWLENTKGRATAARQFVQTLFDARAARADWRELDPLLDVALDFAARAAPDDLPILRTRFEHRLLAMHDAIGADRAGRDLVAVIGPDAQTLNSFAWKMLTRAPYAGQLDALALHAARTMTQDPQWRTYWRADTLALACFRNGRIDEAVELQREAVDGADPASRERYLARLEEYQAARIAASPPAAGRD